MSDVTPCGVKLNSANRRTLNAIFARPTRADVDWDEFLRLYRALGGEPVATGSGSVRRLKLKDVRAAFHEPHPAGEMKKGAVEAARRFLINAGFEPLDETI